jgi:hypothetical protein
MLVNMLGHAGAKLHISVSRPLGEWSH